MSTDKTVLVIGGSSEIGNSICKKFALDNKLNIVSTFYKNTSFDFNQKNIIRKSLDVTSEKDIKNFFSSFNDSSLTSLIYVAGHHKLKPINSLSDGDLIRHFNVNLKGAIDCARFFYKVADSKKSNSIVFISSISSDYGDPGLTAYSSTKAALISASKNLAVEFAKKQIRVNSVSPGWILGKKSSENLKKYNSKKMKSEIEDRYPLGLGSADDIANLTYFLSSDDSKWITGTNIIIDGGRSCT